jgi:ethanolamine ammonia-lyase large subunit
MAFHHTIRGNNFVFQNLKALLAKASPFRTGDALAGIVADSNQERVAAQ